MTATPATRATVIPSTVGTAEAPAALAGENFPVALRILPRRHRDHLWALYRYARYVDDLGDEAAGDRLRLLDAVRADVTAMYAGGPTKIPVVGALAGTVRDCELPIEPLLRLIRANEVDQIVQRYETFEDLLAYCELSANPVGELVLHAFGWASPDRVALADRVCTGLQLLEHLQDVAEDYAAGRIYLPAEDLRRFGVAEDELAHRTASTRLRSLIAYQTDRAVAWLDSGAVLTATLRGWARVAVSGYLAGGRAAATRLRMSGYDPLSEPTKPDGWDVARCWLTATVRRPG